MPSTEPLSSTPPAPQATGSVWEDMIDIFYAPTPVFERRRDGRFGIHLMVLTVLFAVLFFATKPYLEPLADIMREKTAAAMQKARPDMTEEQISKAQAIQEKVGTVGGVLAMPILVLLLGAIIWLVSKFFDGALGFGQAMVVATLSQFPKLIEFIVAGIQGAVMNPSSITTLFSLKASPARFLGPDASAVTLALLSRIDVFVIWCTVLIAIGIHVIGRVPKGKAFMAAAIVWLIGSLPPVFGAMKQG